MKAALKPRLIDFILLIGAYSLLAIQMDMIGSDPGTGWHIKTGEWILNSGEVPKTDPFLAMPAGAPQRAWISDQWGADMIFSLLYTHSGWLGLSWFIFSLYYLIFFGLLLPVTIKLTKSPYGGIIGALLAFKVSQIHFIIRPVVFSFLFFSALYLLIHHSIGELRDKNKVSVRTKSAILILLLLWTNLHPSYILGLIMLGFWLVSAAINELFFRLETQDFSLIKALNSPSVKSSGLLLAAGSAVTLINPYGFDLPLSILSLGSSDYFMNYHMEWLSPNFDDIEGKATEVLALIIILKQLIWPSRPTIGSIFTLICLLFFGHLGLQAVRALPYFAIVATVPAAASIQESLNRGKEWPVLRLIHRLQSLESKTSRGKVTVTAIILGTLIYAATYHSLPFQNHPSGPSYKNYDLAGLKELVKFGQEKKLHKEPIFAMANWGGLITLYGKDIITPIIDDRNTMIGEEFYREYDEALDNLSLLTKILEEHQTSLVFLPKNHKLICPIRNSNLFTEIIESEKMLTFRYSAS